MDTYSKKTPSHAKIIITLGVLVVVVIISVDLINKNKVKRPATENQPDETTVLDVTKTNFSLAREDIGNTEDSDGDGLLDWEEELRGTNPNSADTDEDGTNDKEEIDQNRDPLIPGPNDSNEEIIDDGFFDTITFVPGTLSDQVGKTFIENYLKIGKTSQSDEQLAQFTEQLAREAATAGKIEDKYSELDFQTIPNFESERVREYGNLMALYTIDFQFAFIDVDTNKPNYFDELMNVFDTYDNRIGNLQVPRGVIREHTRYANNIYKIKKAYEAINTSDRDPLKAYYAIGQYEIIADEMPALMRSIAIYLENSGIIYTEEELGIFWQKI